MAKDNINENNAVSDFFDGGGYRFQNVELMRFVGILLIMMHHCYILGYSGAYPGYNCWVWVDFYFILTGAFTYRHYIHKQNQIKDCGNEALRYTFNKFRKFLPYTIIAVLSQYIISNIGALTEGGWKAFICGFFDFPLEIIYLSSSGIVSARLAPIWFLSAMFIVLPLIVYIMNKHPELWKILVLTVPILYFGRMGINTSRAWPNDMVRAFACISLGSFAYMASREIAKKRYGIIGEFLLTLFETGSCVLALYISITNVLSAINLMELLFLVIIALMLSGATYSSTINSRFVRFLGEISMPMFIFHWAVGSMVGYFTENLRLRALLYYIVTIVIGIVATCLTNLLKQRLVCKNSGNEHVMEEI